MRATHAKWPSQSRVRGQQQQRLYAKHRAPQRTLTGGMLDNVSSGLFAKLALDVTDLECDFIAINWFIAMMKQIVQDFSDNGYEATGPDRTASRHQ